MDDLPLCECGCGRRVKLAPKTVSKRGIVKGQPLRFATQSCAARVNGRLYGGTKVRGSEHQSWKGDEAGYSAIHVWLRSHFPKIGVCEFCGRHRKTHYASIALDDSREREDYIELCSVCHRRLDNFIRNKLNDYALRKVMKWM